MCLQYKPTVVACVCIHLACKWSNWVIPPSREGKEWWWYVDSSVTLQLLEELTSEFLAVFEKCPSRLKKKTMAVSAKIGVGQGRLPELQSQLSLESVNFHENKNEDLPIISDGGIKSIGRSVSRGDRTKVDLKEYREKRERERLEKERQEKLLNGQKLENSGENNVNQKITLMSKVKISSPSQLLENKSYNPLLNNAETKTANVSKHHHHHHHHQQQRSLAKNSLYCVKTSQKVLVDNSDESQLLNQSVLSSQNMANPINNSQIQVDNNQAVKLSESTILRDSPYHDLTNKNKLNSEQMSKEKETATVPVSNEIDISNLSTNYTANSLPSFKSLFGTPSPVSPSPAWSPTLVKEPVSSSSETMHNFCDENSILQKNESNLKNSSVSDSTNSKICSNAYKSHSLSVCLDKDDDRRKHREKSKHKKKERHKEKSEKHRNKYISLTEGQSFAQEIPEFPPTLINQGGSGIRVKINLKSTLENSSSMNPIVLSPIPSSASAATGTLKLKISKDLITNLNTSDIRKKNKKMHTSLNDHGLCPPKVLKTEACNIPSKTNR